MRRFDINATFGADCVVSDEARAGEVYHFARNLAGGAILTPIARYFVWQPQFVEGFHRHWRVDVFVRQHPLSPEPIWMSAHRSEELKGKAYGEVFSDD
jgi:hypothetical protein